MKKLIHSLEYDGKKYDLMLSNEPDHIRDCLKKNIPVIALTVNGREDLGFAPWAAESEESLLSDVPYMENVIMKSVGIPETVCMTERLQIRELCAEDALNVRRLFEDASDGGFISPWKGSADETAALLKEYHRYYYDMYGYGYYGIELKGKKELIGIAGFKGLSEEEFEQKKKDKALVFKEIKTGTADRSDNMLEMGYIIAAPFRRKGYAAEAVGALLAMENVSGYSVYAFSDAKNPEGKGFLLAQDPGLHIS